MSSVESTPRSAPRRLSQSSRRYARSRERWNRLNRPTRKKPSRQNPNSCGTMSSWNGPSLPRKKYVPNPTPPRPNRTKGAVTPSPLTSIGRVLRARQRLDHARNAPRFLPGQIERQIRNVDRQVLAERHGDEIVAPSARGELDLLERAGLGRALAVRQGAALLAAHRLATDRGETL